MTDPLNAKSHGLADLRRRIIDEMLVERWRDVWFYPVYEGVQGWQGTGDVFFVGLNPSTGRFPSKADGFLYSRLKENRLADAHLTDVLKLRAAGKAISSLLADPELIALHKRYLAEEVEILRPRRVVGMGGCAFAILREWFEGDPRVCQMPHYSPRIPNAAHFEKVSRVIREFATTQAQFVESGERRSKKP